MRDLETLGQVTTRDGHELVLYCRGDRYQIRLNGLELMTSEAHGSEEAMGEMAREALEHVLAPRVLIGGLGMGFTLRAALDAFGASAEVVVAEVFPEVVKWNRGPLAHLANRPMDDPRVRVVEADVNTLLEEEAFDAILLDVDNGPTAFTLDSNGALYNARGIERLAAALTPGGALVVWSSDEAPNFERRLRRAGLEVTRRDVPACGADGGPLHTLYRAVSIGRS
ncbi:MAG: hypothetical protein AAF560_24840 [Acidobacteriota bacterium]